MPPGLEQDGAGGGWRSGWKFCHAGSGQERPQSHNTRATEVPFLLWRAGSRGEPDAGPGWGQPVPFLSPTVTRICPCQACPFSHTFD